MLRKIHLYLGCFFAPMLIFFAVSGIWQVFGWQRGDKGQKPSLLAYLGTIHTGHMTRAGGDHPGSLTSLPLQIFSIIMAAGLVISIALGVVLAFKYGRGTLALASLALGILFPLAIILLTRL